jgi:hypothetical protein
MGFYGDMIFFFDCNWYSTGISYDSNASGSNIGIYPTNMGI